MKQAKISLGFLHIGWHNTVVGAPKHKTLLNTNNGESYNADSFM